jgi:RNA polymerase sigma-54 factor
LSNKLTTEFTQTQKLVITNDLKSSIELLSLSTVELAERIQKELIDNPFLEEIPSHDSKRTNPLHSLSEQKNIARNKSIQETDGGYEQFQIKDKKSPDTFQKFLESSPDKKSLIDYLIDQLILYPITKKEMELGKELITMIDDKGFLNLSDSDSKYLSTKFKNTNHKKILSIIKELDPIGIGSSGIQEALQIQYLNLYGLDETFNSIIMNYFQELESHDYKKISKELNITQDTFNLYLSRIKTLKPFPSHGYETRSSEYIIPDIIISKTGKDISLTINDDWIPNLKFNNLEKEISKGLRDKTTKEYIQTKSYSANWLIKSIEQRRRSLKLVVYAILDFQKDFFEKGVSHLRPMTLKDIANKVELHESTISRITSNKYVQSSWGINELKWFFSSGIKTQDDSQASSKSIQDTIKNLIKSENLSSPYTDQDIVELLSKDGIQIARRTVAKYRGVLNILSSSERKK